MRGRVKATAYIIKNRKIQPRCKRANSDGDRHRGAISICNSPLSDLSRSQPGHIMQGHVVSMKEERRVNRADVFKQGGVFLACVSIGLDGA